MADFVDPENNEVYGNTTLTLNVDNTGSVLSVFTYDGENEVYSATITWSSTTTTITFVYDDGQEDLEYLNLNNMRQGKKYLLYILYLMLLLIDLQCLSLEQ